MGSHCFSVSRTECFADCTPAVPPDKNHKTLINIHGPVLIRATEVSVCVCVFVFVSCYITRHVKLLSQEQEREEIRGGEEGFLDASQRS